LKKIDLKIFCGLAPKAFAVQESPFFPSFLLEGGSVGRRRISILGEEDL